MPTSSEKKLKPVGEFDITSEDQLLNYGLVGGFDGPSKEQARAKMDEAKNRIRQNGGLTRSDRLELGLIGKDEAPDDFNT